MKSVSFKKLYSKVACRVYAEVSEHNHFTVHKKQNVSKIPHRAAVVYCLTLSCSVL